MSGSPAVPREPAIFRNPSRALAAAGGLFVLLAILTAVVSTDHRLGIDDAWWRTMRDARNATFTDVSKGLNVFGNFVVQFVIRLAVAALLVARSWWRRLAAWAFLALFSTPICDLAKALVDRPRPVGGLVHATGASFPSGHAVAAAATAFGIVLVFTRPGRARIVGFVIAAIFAVVMGWSRTELGVHWLTDVVAGAALGTAVTFAAFAVADLVGRPTSEPLQPAPARQ